MKLRKKTVLLSILIAAAGVYIWYEVTKIPFSEKSPAINERAPEIALADLSGKMVSLADFGGKVILVNFWASWCPPCKSEMAWFQKVYETFGNRGFAVIAIALDDIKPSIIKEMGITFPVAIANKRVIGNYGDISGVPVSFLIGRDGRIVKKIKEVYPEKDLRADVEKALITR